MATNNGTNDLGEKLDLGEGVLAPETAAPKDTDVAEGPDKIEVKKELVNGFGIEMLYNFSGAARLQVKSADPELKLEENPFGKLIQNPLADRRRILQRQALIEGLLDSGKLQEFLKLSMSAAVIGLYVEKLFEPIEVRDNVKFPLISAYKRFPDDTSIVGYMLQIVATIQEAIASMKSLGEQLQQQTDPFLRKMGNDIIKLYDSVKFLTKDYILNELDENNSSVQMAPAIASNLIGNFCTFMRFAELAEADGYAKVSFDDKKPAEYKSGWNYLRPKKGQAKKHWEKPERDQVLNHSPRHNPVTVYTGSNMSGKSFELKKQFSNQLVAQTFGYAPCAEGNFHIYDSFHFLDRAATEHSNDLSAFGNEVVSEWMPAIASFGDKPFLCCDEGYSTTSPDGQYILLRATDLFLRERGARVLYATHNEKFVQDAGVSHDVGIYHLRTYVDDKGKVQYDHLLEQGAADSMSLAVAKDMGLSAKVTGIAERFLAGEQIKIGEIEPRIFPVIERYSEDEREKLKQGEGVFIDVLNGAGERRMFRNYSEDPEIADGPAVLATIRGIPEHTTHQEYTTAVEMSHNLPFLMQCLVFDAQKGSTKDVLERQRTYETLTAKNRFDEMRALGLRVNHLIEYFTYLLRSMSTLLDFNTDLHPFAGGFHCDISDGDEEILIDFLEMNRILLADKFPFGDRLDSLKKLSELYKKLQEMQELRDLDDVIKLKAKDSKRVITNPEALDLFEQLKAKFGIPEGFKFDGNNLTIAGVCEYHKWLPTSKWDRSWTGESRANLNLARNFMAAANATEFGAGYLPESSKAVDEILIGIANEYALENQGRWGGIVNIKRVRALLEELKNTSCPEAKWRARGDEIDKLEAIYHQLYSAQVDIGYDMDGNNEGVIITHDRVRHAVRKLTRELSDAAKHLPSVPIFDAPIEKMRPHLEKLIERLIDSRDTDPYSGGPGKKVLKGVGLSILIQKDDAIAAFIDALRTVDSVHVQEGANVLSARTGVYFNGPSWRRMDEKTEFSDEAKLMSGPPLLAFLKKIFAKTAGEAFRDLQPLQEEKMALANEYPDIFTDSYLYREFFTIYDSLGKWKSCNDSEKARHCILNYGKYFVDEDEWGGDFETSVKDHYLGRIGRRDSKEAPNAVMSEFFDKYIANSKMYKQMNELVPKLEALHQKAKAYGKKHGLDKRLKECDKDYARRVPEDLRSGDLSPLHDLAAAKFLQVAYKTLPFPHSSSRLSSGFDRSLFRYDEDSEIQQALSLVTTQIVAMFGIGRIINEQGFTKVEFHDKPEIEMRDVWSTYKPKDEQVHNDVVFNDGERLKLINGANMSGKTFWLKEFASGAMWAAATGYVPAGSAKMPIFDTVVYLDRVRAAGDKNLSAFGNEVTFWKKVGDDMDAAGNPLLVGAFDEIFSTASPKYEEALGFGQMYTGVKGGHFMAVAHHNHAMINRLTSAMEGHAHPYYFATEMRRGEGGGMEFHRDFEMKPGHVGSQPIDVAESLGLDRRIIEIARMLAATQTATDGLPV